MLKKYESILIPLMAVFSGLLLGAVIMLVFGYDPIWGYEELLYTAFGSVKSVGEIFRAVAPLVFTALGFAVASRAGFFNVGLSGQALVGWVFAGWFALANPDMPRPLLILATVVIAMIAGGIAGAIPGFLRAFLGTSEVIVTIMMNYILLYFSNHIIREVFADELMKNTDSSINVSANASYQTEWLRALTDNSRMNIGIFFAIVAVFVIWFLFAKTTLGFEIRAAGLNPTAADYAGMSTKRTIVMSMIISGALAGLGGAVQGLGTFQNVYIQSANLDIGFNGMSVALLASNSPLGIPFAAFLFGALSVGSSGMVRAQIPPELVNVVTASIIFFIGVKFIFEQLLNPKIKGFGSSNTSVFSNVGLSVVLTVLTLGIYGLFWYIYIIKKVTRLNEPNASVMGEILLNLFIPFYSIYWFYKANLSIVAYSKSINREIENKSIMYILFSIFGLQIVAIAIMQHDLNTLVLNSAKGVK